MSYQKVVLVGWLGREPFAKETNDGDTYCTMSLSAGNEWHNVAAFGRTADIALEWLDKGDKILIEGKLSYYQYQDGDGKRHKVANVMANEIRFMDLKSDKSEKKRKERLAERKDNAEGPDHIQEDVDGVEFDMSEPQYDFS